jgi:hypothetical protein
MALDVGNTLPGPGQISQDYTGSYDEWYERVVADLIRRYVAGLGGLGSEDPELGRPSPEDAGSGANGQTGQYSHATEQYWRRFVAKYGTVSEFVKTNYGPPPQRRASYAPDPNSAGAITNANNTAAADRDRAQRDWQSGENNADRDWQTGENALDRTASMAELQAQIAAQMAQIQAQIQAQKDLQAGQQTWQSGENALERAARMLEIQTQLAAQMEQLQTQIQAQKDLQNSQQQWQTGENALDRQLREQLQALQNEFDAAEAEKIRAWQSVESEKQRGWQSTENQADRDLAREREAGETQRLREQIESNEKIAFMNDATQRYLEEGRWGVQKYIAELQESGAMERLVLQLGLGEKELAQRATEERNRHHENMVGLTLEVAKYDTELASQPRNWLKYGEWLKRRGQVVNGLTLSMAAQEAGDIDPGEIANSDEPGAALAALQEAQEQQAAPPSPYTVNGIDLQTQNYEQLLNQLLGPQAATTEDYAPANLQGILSDLDTSKPPAQQQGGGGQAGGFSLQDGDLQFETQGTKHDYRRFANMTPTKQQMAAGAVEYMGKPLDDFLYEMNQSRPKGGAVGAGAYG